MKSTTINLLKIKLNDIAIMIAMVATIFVVGGVVDYHLYRSNPTENIVQIGIIMSIVTYALYELIFEGLGMRQFFNNIVGMGVTRKNFFASYVITAIIKNTIGLMIIAIFGYIERIYCKAIYSDRKMQDIYFTIFTGKGALITISLMIVLTMISILIGVLILRYGKIAFWIIWAIWMIAALAPRRIEKHFGKNNSIQRAFECIGKNVKDNFINTDFFVPIWLIVFVGILAAIYAFIYKVLISKQQVTQ